MVHIFSTSDILDFCFDVTNIKEDDLAGAIIKNKEIFEEVKFVMSVKLTIVNSRAGAEVYLESIGRIKTFQYEVHDNPIINNHPISAN